MDLTDHQWQLIQPLLPPSSVSGRGRPAYPYRLVLDAIFWKFRNDAPWYDLPARFPAWQTCFYRYRMLDAAGVLEGVYGALARDLFQHLDFTLADVVDRGLIKHYPVGWEWKSRVDLIEDGTWQTATLLLLLRVIVKKATAKPSRRR